MFLPDSVWEVFDHLQQDVRLAQHAAECILVQTEVECPASLAMQQDMEQLRSMQTEHAVAFATDEQSSTCAARPGALPPHDFQSFTQHTVVRTLCVQSCALMHKLKDGTCWFAGVLEAEACERLGAAVLAAALLSAPSDDLSVRRTLAAARRAALDGAAVQCLDALTDVLLHLDVGTTGPCVQAVPSAVVACVSKLISITGMQAVQSIFENRHSQIHAALELTIELAFERGTDGCEC